MDPGLTKMLLYNIFSELTDVTVKYIRQEVAFKEDGYVKHFEQNATARYLIVNIVNNTSIMVMLLRMKAAHYNEQQRTLKILFLIAEPVE